MSARSLFFKRSKVCCNHYWNNDHYWNNYFNSGWEWILNLTSHRNHYWNNDHYWNNYFNSGWEWISNLTSHRNHYWNNDHYWNNYFNRVENAFQTFIFVYIFPLTTISFIIIYYAYNNYTPSNSFKFQCISHH